MVDLTATLGHMLELYEPGPDLLRFYALRAQGRGRLGRLAPVAPARADVATTHEAHTMARLDGKVAVILGAASRDNMGQVMARSLRA